MASPTIAVADSLQALRNGTTADQWASLKENPLVRDLLLKCSDLEASELLAKGFSVSRFPSRANAELIFTP